jgi:type IV fimbrial biogenesis protein FimT
MRKRVRQNESIGDKYLNKLPDSQIGASLLELMAALLIIAILATITMPLLQEQIAVREIDALARRFIAHAHFARQQALHLGQSVRMMPHLERSWDDGWIVVSGQQNKPWISQGKIEPLFFRGGGRQWIDPHTKQLGIGFNAAGAAKSTQGGFVANRLILGHSRVPGLERQLILGSGGRWRICDPARDAKRCH